MQTRSGRATVAALVAVAVTASGAADASAPNAPAWEIVDIAPVDVDGSPVSLSPDGEWLAGMLDDQVCVWRLADLTETEACSADVRGVHAESIAWSPDSSAVAFSTRAYEYLIDSDIHVLDVATGDVANVTDDGFDDQLQLGDDEPAAPVPVDVMPTWTPDGAAIVFSRSIWDTASDDASTDIVSVPRAGGEPTALGTVDWRFAIYTPMHVLSDGAVLYAVGTGDVSDDINGIWRLDPDGTSTMLVPGHAEAPFPGPAISSVRERDDGYVIAGYSVHRAAAFSVEEAEAIAFQWSSSSGSQTPLEPVSADPGAFVWAAVIDPDGGTVLQITSMPAATATVELVGPSTSTVPVPETDADGANPPMRHPVPTWAGNGTALVPALGRSGPMLVTLSQT